MGSWKQEKYPHFSHHSRDAFNLEIKSILSLHNINQLVYTIVRQYFLWGKNRIVLKLIYIILKLQRFKYQWSMNVKYCDKHWHVFGYFLVTSGFLTELNELCWKATKQECANLFHSFCVSTWLMKKTVIYMKNILWL